MLEGLMSRSSRARRSVGLSEWSGRAQIKRQMMAIELQAPAKIQPVSRMPRIPRVQMQPLTPIGFGVSHQPVHERTGKAPRRCLGQRRQVVYVKDFSPRQELGESETGGALNHAAMLQRNDPVGLGLLPPYLG